MRRLWVAVVAIALVSGCSPGATPVVRTAGPAAPALTPATPAARATSASITPSAIQLADTYDQLLGEHTILAIRLMRAVTTPTLSGQFRAYALLQRNSGALTGQVVAAYGPTLGAAYKKVWDAHVLALFDYARGYVSKDKGARDRAHAALLRYSDEYGSWLAKASNGRVSAKVGSAGVRMHIEDLISQIDAYEAKDYAKAYLIERHAYEHMFAAGTGLATGSVRPEQAMIFQAPTTQLRSALAMLLGEHVQLVIEAQRARFAGSPEFSAAAAQLNANTTSISNAIGAVAGPARAAVFNGAWASHVDALVAYATAVVRHDETARATVGRQMAQYARTLATLLSGLVQNNVSSAAVLEALTTHDAGLMEQMDAFAAKNYSRAEQVALDGYEQILGVAGVLAGAIEQNLHRQLPSGAAQTGGGSTARAFR